MTVNEALEQALSNLRERGGAGDGGGKRKRDGSTRENSTKEERAEVIRLIRLHDTERILKKTGKKDSERREKARIWELIEEAFNVNRSGSDKFSLEKMQNIYKRYRTEKRKKADKGIVNSQESGFSLIENTEPLPDPLPPQPLSDEDADLERYIHICNIWQHIFTCGKACTQVNG